MNLTAEQIDSMPAGRELDVLIAEKVMEWKYISGARIRDGFDTPRFSTDISAAWEVVEKFDYLYLFRLDHPIEDYAGRIGRWEAKLVFKEKRGVDKRFYYALADTAPLAICRAALKAKLSAQESNEWLSRAPRRSQAEG